MTKISVIIPIYNALADVKMCLESISENFNFSLGEVYLINDCSNEETSEFLVGYAKSHSEFKLISNEENLGFIKTCNKGMKIAQNEIVVLLNSDTKIPKEFCERIIKCFESDEEIGVASPVSSHTCSYYIPLPKGYNLEKMNKNLRSKHTCCYPLIPAAEGFCFCIRKKVIDQQGYLDEIYGKGYHEEVDFAYRAITNGWKNVLIDDLYVYHKRQASFGKEQREKLIAQNNPEFHARWGGFRQNYEKENNLVNPIIQIEKELFPIRTFLTRNNRETCPRNFGERIFSIKNTKDKRHKVLTIVGLKLKFKKHPTESCKV